MYVCARTLKKKASFIWLLYPDSIGFESLHFCVLAPDKINAQQNSYQQEEKKGGKMEKRKIVVPCCATQLMTKTTPSQLPCPMHDDTVSYDCR